MENRPPLIVFHRWFRWIWIGYWAGLFTLTHLPKLGRVRSPAPHADKLVHFGLFFGLVVLGHYAAPKHGTSSAGKVWTWSGIYLAYGILDEWLQGFVGRTPSMADWLADAAGVAAATLVILYKRRADCR